MRDRSNAGTGVGPRAGALAASTWAATVSPMPSARSSHATAATSAEGGMPPVRGNALDGLGSLLSSLGIMDTGTRDGVEGTVQRELERRGFTAQVLELRWGTLTLAASPQEARLLRFDQDVLLAAIDASHPDVVTAIKIRVLRP